MLPEPPNRRTAERLNGRIRPGCVKTQIKPGLLQQDLSFLSQLECACGSVRQPYAKRLFQSANILADGSRADAECAGSGC